MTKQVQRRRGSSSEHTSFTGAAGEISVNTTNNTMHVHDGSTAGGFESARSDLDNVTTSDIASGISGGTVATLTITSADINGGTLDNVTIGGSTAAAGTFTNVTATGTINLNGATVSDGGTVTTVDIDGGSIDGATIGANSAAAGTFTTLTSTGDAVIGGDLTVNGTTTTINSTTVTVDDLNMVLASGAADAAAANGAGLTIDGASATFTYASTGDKWTMNKDLDVTGEVEADSLTVTGDLTVDTDTLFVDSTNNRVGVGETSSLLGKLHVKTADSGGNADSGADELVLENSGDAGMTILSGTTNSGSIRFGDSDDNDNGIIIYNHGASPYMRFFVDAAERMRIDNSGNLLVGDTTTPSDVTGLYVKNTDPDDEFAGQLGLKGTATSGAANTGAAIAFEGHNGSGNRSLGQLAVLKENGTSGDNNSYMRFVTRNSSGSAERMRIDSSGNVDLYQGNNLTWRYAAGSTIRGSMSIDSADNITFSNGSSNTERMRIDSSGNVGVGTTSASGKLTIGGDDAFEAITLRDNTASADMFKITSAEYVGSGGNVNKFSAVNSSGISFELGGLERMRLSHTSPALSIGKTTFGTAGGGFTVYGDTAPQCYFNKSQSGAVNGILFYYLDTYVGGLNYTNTNTSLATGSDERLKDNIENSDDAGAKIDAMQVRQFDWKSTGEHQEYGFVAQELEPVFAHAVHTDKEGDYKSVDYACLVPMLVKEIQSLRQRIADLENA